jgi:metal-responsive CopG/Arc/MetJ family transcriptional regulator
MATVEKFTISLPKGLAEQLQAECKRRGQSRSGMIQQVLVQHFKAERRRKDIERYVEGYRKHPETEEEFGAGLWAMEGLAKNYPKQEGDR